MPTNDFVTLTIRPIGDDPHRLLWEGIPSIISEVEQFVRKVAHAIFEDSRTTKYKLVLVAPPLPGSVKFRFRLEVSGRIDPRPSTIKLASDAIGPVAARSLLQKGADFASIGSFVLAAAILLTGDAPTIDPEDTEALAAQSVGNGIKSKVKIDTNALGRALRKAEAKSISLSYRDFEGKEYRAYVPLLYLSNRIESSAAIPETPVKVSTYADYDHAYEIGFDDFGRYPPFDVLVEGTIYRGAVGYWVSDSGEKRVSLLLWSRNWSLPRKDIMRGIKVFIARAERLDQINVSSTAPSEGLRYITDVLFIKPIPYRRTK